MIEFFTQWAPIMYYMKALQHKDANKRLNIHAIRIVLLDNGGLSSAYAPANHETRQSKQAFIGNLTIKKRI